MGVDDALVLVAVDDRTDYIWVSDGLDSITDDELDAIITGTLEPALRDGDFAGAAIATVEALGEAADSAAPSAGPLLPGPATTGPTPADGAGSGGSGGDGGGIGLGTIVGIALIAGGGYYLYRRWRRRQRCRSSSFFLQLPWQFHLCGKEPTVPFLHLALFPLSILNRAQLWYT